MTSENEDTGSKAAINKKKNELGKISLADANKTSLVKIEEVDKCFGVASIFLCNDL